MIVVELLINCTFNINVYKYILQRYLTNCFIFAGKKGSKVKKIMNKYHVDLIFWPEIIIIRQLNSSEDEYLSFFNSSFCHFSLFVNIHKYIIMCFRWIIVLCRKPQWSVFFFFIKNENINIFLCSYITLQYKI